MVLEGLRVPLALSYDAEMQGYSWADTWAAEAPLFMGGDVLHVRAAGGEAPAFDLEVVAPPALELTAPDLGPERRPIVRADGLHFTWEAEGESTVTALVEVDVPNSHTAVHCSAALSEGELFMPPELLMQLSTTNVDLGSFGILSVTTRSSRRIDLDAWNIDLQVHQGLSTWADVE